MGDKPIIIIGGASGVGKTTLSRKLSDRLSIDHRLGSGFIREILRSKASKNDLPYLFENTFKPISEDSIIEHYRKQINYLEYPIIDCVKRARAEGTSIIIEGSNIDPDIINKCEIDIFILLYINDSEIHERFINGTTHKYRKVSKSEFINVRQIQDFLLNRAKAISSKKIILVENSDIEESINNLMYTLANKSKTNTKNSYFLTKINEKNLIIEYQKRFDYEFNSIGRRWQMLTVLIAVSGFSISFYDRIDYKLSIAIFNILTAIFSIAYWLQVRNRAYANDLRLKEISDLLGIKGMIHIVKKEKLLRFSSVSFYAILFMISIVLVWLLMLLSEIFCFRLV